MTIGFVIAGIVGAGIGVALVWGAYKRVREYEEERQVTRKLAELLGVKKGGQ